MVDCYFIIGDDSVGKSATIRALTGIWAAEPAWPIRYIDGIYNTYVLVRSAQEGMRIRPPDLISDISNSGSPRAIVPLRLDPHNGAPSANDYISALGQHGWPIKGIGIIGERLSEVNVPAGCFVVRMADRSTSLTMCANERASYLRFGWQIF